MFIIINHDGKSTKYALIAGTVITLDKTDDGIDLLLSRPAQAGLQVECGERVTVGIVE